MEHNYAIQLRVRNAGLVILQNHFPLLFERLGLVKNNQFTHEDAQQQAAHYLHFLVTGHEDSQDPDLALNKVLCGLAVSQPIEYGINSSPEQKTLMEGLISSVISHWPAIGSSSIDGFRGNWLVRDGLLVEHRDKWELTVEKRPYDILIHQSPFAFSIIHYSWMPKPLHVTWPY